jgi:hypothetical protein
MDLDLRTIAYRTTSGTPIIVCNLSADIAELIAKRIQQRDDVGKVTNTKQLGIITDAQYTVLLRFPAAPYDIKAWDDAMLSLGLPMEGFGWMVRARERIGIPRPNGPSRKASDRCESGKLDYCTCDTCF